ncbi:nucleoside hydrolase [Streptomyces hygroscopicus]|uniref:nucleoside hydrolase n=1 Tax=Streptomyces hygroscopicus TaxID=1912 RepID=UPI00076765A5|nr:nucleoside hydrolase [Streptomyces hygroscopicus]
MPPAVSTRLSVVIDTDPGVDDTWAILFLAAQPDVEIVAVGAAHGNVPTAVAAANALRVLDVVGLDQVPVAVGHPVPLQQPLQTAEFVHGADGLGGRAGPPSPRRVSAESAAEQLVRLARQRPGELTSLALAPLTNIALALRMEPNLPRLLRRVVFMGGAFHVPGNVTAWAEANSAHDPEAAEEVLRAGFDLIMVPLDMTEHAWADASWLKRIADATAPAARFASSVLETYVALYSDAHGTVGCVLHDPLAAAIMVDESLATYKERQVMVELAGHARGVTLIDERKFRVDHGGIPDQRPTVRIAATVDAATAMDRVHRALITSEAGQSSKAHMP